MGWPAADTAHHDYVRPASVRNFGAPKGGQGTMRRHMLRASVVGLAVWCLSGCAVTATVPPGEVVYEPPVVVEEPSVSVWGWWPWPHYDVEHHYVVEHDHVTIQDRHYFPSYGRSRAYIRQRQAPRLVQAWAR